MLQPIIDESLCNRLEDSERVASISDLEKRDGPLDEPLRFLDVAGRPIAIPIAAAVLALGEQIAGEFTHRLRIDTSEGERIA